QALREGVGINCTADGGKETVLHIAVRSGDPEMLDLVLSHKPDTEVQDGMGYTPLIGAARNKETQKIETLLKAGAAIDGKDSKGHTPIWHAINFKNIDTAKQLL